MGQVIHMAERRITARRPTTCDCCEGPIKEGQGAIWVPGQSMVHIKCPRLDPATVHQIIDGIKARLTAASSGRPM